MSKMNFGLEQVLTYRKEMEKVCKQEFSSAQQKFDGAFERLKDEESRVDILNSEYLDKLYKGITSMDLQLYSVFLRRKSTDIKQQRQETATLNDRVSEKRDILIEAAKDKKVLQTLKEKQQLAHKLEVLYKERVFMEEIALRMTGAGK